MINQHDKSTPLTSTLASYKSKLLIQKIKTLELDQHLR